MIFSMYTNAGLITVFYPLAVFGYALLNEVRPNHKFWKVIMIFSICVLIIKFICSIQAVRDALSKNTAKYWVNMF